MSKVSLNSPTCTYVLEIRVRGTAISKVIQQAITILSRKQIIIDSIIFKDKKDQFEGSFLIQIQVLDTKIENIKAQINKILEVEDVAITEKKI